MHESVLHNYFNVLRIAFLAFVSYLRGGRPVSRQSLRIGKLSIIPFRAQDITYEAILYADSSLPYSFKFLCKGVSLSVHRPTLAYPRWLSFCATDVFYTSSTCDVSSQTLTAEAWLFPKLLKRTCGPWVSAELDGLRIRVFHSNKTPYFIQRLRENVAGSIVAGDIFRLEDFWSNVQFAGLSEHAPNPAAARNGKSSSNGHAGKGDGSDNDDDDWRHPKKREAFLEGRPHSDVETDSDSDDSHDSAVHTAVHGRRELLMPVFPHQTDALRVSALVRGLHVDTHEGRVLSFGRIDAQMRRDWDTNHGSLVMIAEDARWTRVPWTYQREYTGFWTQLGTSLMQFPLDLIHTLNYPVTTINLYVPRTDITFDEFRIRDAEMLKQAFSMMREKCRHSEVQWTDVFLDFILGAFVN